MELTRCNFDKNLLEAFGKAGIDINELLKNSGLPQDLPSKDNILLTRAEYFSLIKNLGILTNGDTKTIENIVIGSQMETLSPPVFAAYCSSNGLEFLNRLSLYKRLVGPVDISIIKGDKDTEVVVRSDNDSEPLPPFFAQLEKAYILSIMRKCTSNDIKPISTTPNSLLFSTCDLEQPFITRNDQMLSYLEPELKKRLSEMDIDDSVSAKVRSALVELLPMGKATIEDVASRLYLSKRSLQRKLSEEHTTFQKQLNSTRLLLAQDYLRNSNRTNSDIAFLLGYEDTTSFLRAFNLWTGKSVTEYKKEQI